MYLRTTRAVWLLTALACFAQERPVKIVLVGDSTVNDQGGWGPGIRASFNSRVEILNLAKNGASTLSFRKEGRWEPALAAKPDYILIQFGHNDVPGKGLDRETVAAGSYTENLARFIAEVRAAGAKPILVTSIVRRNFSPDGKIRPDSLVPYVEAVRRLAAREGVPVMDMYARTLEQAERLGPAGCEALNAKDKDGKSDHTHLGPKGRLEIGAIAAEELVKAEPTLLPYLVRIEQ